MNATLRSLIPPAVFDLRQKLRPTNPAFDSYQAALSQCRTGYNAEELARVVVQKTLTHRGRLPTDPLVTDMRTVTLALAIRTAAGKALNCLDFGGAAGAHYLQAQQLFGDTIKFRWHVVETPCMVEQAGSLAGDGLEFFPDLDAAAQAFGEPVDLVITSGALQYTPDPLGSLKRLCSVGARHILLTRTALADVPLARRTIIQTCKLSENGPGPLPKGMADGEIQYPATFADRLEVEQALAERYSIDMRFSEERGAYMIDGRPISMYGYLASARP